MQVDQKYYCLSAAAAVVKYMEFLTGAVISANSLKIAFNLHEQTLTIGWNTARVLEIVNNMRDHRNADHTLYGVLANARTRGGKKVSKDLTHFQGASSRSSSVRL